jgi:hypothetical protein
MYKNLGFSIESVERAAEEQESQFDIHSAEAIRFTETVIGASSDVIKTLKEGLILDFTKQPGVYREDNNRSAQARMDIVRSKVAEWEEGGFVERISEPARCCNPLSVVEKYNPVSDKTKFRVVLDMSRHVNDCIEDRPVKLDDLTVAESILEQNDYLTAFDLKNQFFHVKLHPSQKCYFGFAVPDENGEFQFFQFRILVYGCKPAVAIVTKLLKPIKSYLHKFGVKTTIYVDDGRVAASSEVEAKAKTVLTMWCIQLSGWNIQWQKSSFQPTQQLYYLGFITDTIAMRYFAPIEKLELLSADINSLLELSEANRPVSARHIARVTGKIVSMQRSHGNIVHVMSRAVQHELGLHTLWHGWDTGFKLSKAAVSELRFMLDILYQSNGQYIFSQTTLSQVVSLTEVRTRVAQIMASTANLEELYVSDASETHAYVYKADGSFEYVRDFEFSAAETQLSSGHRELLAIKKALALDAEQFRKVAATKVYWQTDSKNCFNFLMRGSKKPYIQQEVFAIKRLEKELNVIIIPVWTPRDQARLIMADLGSKFSASTDEWAVDRCQLIQIFQKFNWWPTVDAFAAGHNRICEKFYSMLPQTGAAGVNFFAQELDSSEIYFCCPPVRLIIPCFQFLTS